MNKLHKATPYLLVALAFAIMAFTAWSASTDIAVKWGAETHKLQDSPLATPTKGKPTPEQVMIADKACAQAKVAATRDGLAAALMPFVCDK